MSLCMHQPESMSLSLQKFLVLSRAAIKLLICWLCLLSGLQRVRYLKKSVNGDTDCAVRTRLLPCSLSQASCDIEHEPTG